MEYCDFSAVVSTLKRYFHEGYGSNQSVFLDELFYSFFYQEEVEPPVYSTGLVSRWFSGQKRISPDIVRYYTHRANQKKLAQDLEQNVLGQLSDGAMAVEEVYALVVGDYTISEQKKSSLTRHYPCQTPAQQAGFLADVILFVLERPFVPRAATGVRELPPGARSPVVADLIFGNQVPSPCRYFCGRDGDLERLHQLLQSQHKVALHGIAGIGKSELAKAYVKAYASCYTNTVYIPYTGDLRRDIGEMDFADDWFQDGEEERFRKHNRFLRTLKPDTLLVLDNLNATAIQEPLLSVVLNYRCRILITTRCRLSSVAEQVVGEFENREDLLGLMGQLYAGAAEQPDLMEALIQMVHGHTFAVELTARLLEHGILEPEELCEKLRREKVDLDATDYISVDKDGRSRKDTYCRHIHTLFSLYELSGEELDVLRNLSLMPVTGVHKRLFAHWLRQRDLNTINQLVEKGIVHPMDARSIGLKPLLREIAYSETQPSVSACELLLSSIQGTCLQWETDLPNHVLLHQVMEGILDGIVCDDGEAYLLFLETCFSFFHRYHYHTGMHRVVEAMAQRLDDPAEEGDIHRALYLDFQATLEPNLQRAKGFLSKAIHVLPEESEEAAPVLSQLHAHLGAMLQEEQDFAGARGHMETALSLCQTWGLEQDHSYVDLVTRYALLLARQGEETRGMELLERMEREVCQSQRQPSLDYGKILDAMGTIQLQMGDVPMGTECMRRAEEIRLEYQFLSQKEVAEQRGEIQRRYIRAGITLGKKIVGKA